MGSEPALGFDCAGGWCTAAVVAGGACRAVRFRPMSTGQAEQLMPMLDEVLAEAGIGWGDVRAIGVGVGPGNFTGLRIAVAAARGLALSLGVPAVGVPLAQARRRGLPGPLWVLEAGPTGHLIVTAPDGTVALMAAGAVATHIGDAPVTGAAASQAGAATPLPPAMPLAEAVARIAAERAATETARPAPLYLRPPDAAPGREAAPVLLD